MAIGNDASKLQEIGLKFYELSLLGLLKKHHKQNVISISVQRASVSSRRSVVVEALSSLDISSHGRSSGAAAAVGARRVSPHQHAPSLTQTGIVPS